MTSHDWENLVKKRTIFIVHGHDEKNLTALEGLLKEEFRMESVVLNRVADRGRTVIEKFEDEAKSCCYAVVLLTPDDHVRTEEGDVWQPRQNVMFELGWFCGHLGRDKILYLTKKGTQLPSDFAGVLSKTFRESVTEEQLVREIEAELRHHGIV